MRGKGNVVNVRLLNRNDILAKLEFKWAYFPESFIKFVPLKLRSRSSTGYLPAVAQARVTAGREHQTSFEWKMRSLHMF